MPCYNAKALEKYEDEADLYKEQVQAVQVFSVNDKRILITDEDVYLMAQVVCAESRAEPYEGKVAVASVILNRLQSSQFPKSVEEVIKQKNAFSCIRNGEIKIVPDPSSYSAVLEALKGKDPTGKALFFYNPKISTSTWMIKVNKTNVKSIGNHVFFAVK
jgi:N-acetylmuramoyl-L-alanine amidase